LEYTKNYNLRKPEDTDPADIQDLNYNADAIDGKLKEIEDWEAAHLQASNPHSITPALIGAETPTGAQQKANQAETNAKSYADIVTNSALNSAKDYADDVLESANSHTDQVASDLSQKLNETRIKVLDVEQDVSNISKVLTNLNPNQEPKQKVNGYGIISLPKNAANGQISSRLLGQSATNLLGGKGDNSWTLPARPTSGTAPVFFDNLNLPQDKYLIFYELVQTVETFAINSPYYNSASTTNRDPDQKTKNNTVGRKVWKLDAPEAITKIGWWVYETESEVRVKNFMVVRATEEDWLLSEEKLVQKYNWHNGTKSTVSAMRLKSVSADETETSTAYVVAKNDEGNIEELRSLPNGVKDEVNVADGKLIKRVSDEFTLPMSGWTFYSINEQGFVILLYYTTLPNFARQIYGEFIPTTGMVVNNSNLPAYTTTSSTAIRANANTECIATGYNTGTNLYIVVHLDNYNKTQDNAGANAWVNENMQGVTLTYQLATPIEIPIQTSGSLVSYPSGTVYIEPFVADAGIYTDKMSVLHQDLPIKALEKISKVDFETGVETELDPAQAIIAADKLSFTHPDLEAGDIVFFVYEYDRESTVGETEIEYYDSRYVIKDSVTGKFYKWHIVVADGVPSIELVEV